MGLYMKIEVVLLMIYLIVVIKFNARCRRPRSCNAPESDRLISNPRSVTDHVFSSKVDMTMLPSQSSPNDHIWQKGPAELQAEALQKLQLVQLLKQVNPDLHICPPQKQSNLIGQAKPTVEKGTQVPDTRIPYFGPRKAKPKRLSHVDYVGPGIRIQPRYNRVIHDKCNLATWRDASRETHRHVSVGVGNEDFHPAHSLATSMLRADAPPHIPRSVRERSHSTDVIEQLDEQFGKNDSCAQFKPQINKAGVKKNIESSDTDKTDTCSQANDKLIKNHALSSGDDDSVVVVLNEPKEENDLQRKTGQFFCPRCLRGWSSRNVWCVRGTSRVYVKQTCNKCNKVVNPYMVLKTLQPIKSVQ